MQKSIEIVTRSSETSSEDFDKVFSSFFSFVPEGTAGVDTSSRMNYTSLLLKFSSKRKSEFWVAIDPASSTILARVGADIPLQRQEEGSVGFFECQLSELGRSAGLLLLARAEKWLHDRGVKRAIGPMDFNSWFQYRFKLRPKEGHAAVDHPWEPTSPDIHLEVFAQSGFSESIRFSSFFFEVSGREIWDAYIARLSSDHSRVLDEGFQIRGLKWGTELISDLKHIFSLSNAAFPNNPMFEEIPFEIFSSMTMASSTNMNGGGSRICFTKNGEAAAFLFAFVSGNTVVYKTVAVHPQFQAIGIGNALTFELCEFCRELDVRKSVGALIRSGNNSELIGRGFSKFAVSSGQHEYILMQKEIA